MLIRVEQGKGRKDRYVMLAPHLLALLRAWWRAARPQGWLFPGQNRVNPLTTRQLNRAGHAAAERAKIDNPVSLHTLRHSFATHLLEFIRRFLRHVLPSGFHRIRHSGLFAHAVRAANITRARACSPDPGPAALPPTLTAPTPARRQRAPVPARAAAVA
jgi:integrase